MPRRMPTLATRLILTTAAVALVAAGCRSGGAGSAQTSTTAGPPPAPLGRPNPLGAKWDWSRLDSFKPYLASLSGGATFYDFAWCDVEPSEGARDWSTVDAVAQSARALGFELYLKIRTGSCWATVDASGATTRRRRSPKGVSSMPVDMAQYQAFITDTVKRFSPLGVHEYAIENEVNAPIHWAGSSADYVALVTAAGQAIHAASPDARVVDGGLGSTVYGEAIARRLLGEGRESDAVAAYQRYYARRFAVRAQQLPQVSNATDLRATLASGQAARNLDYFDATVSLADQKLIDDFEIHFYEKWDNVPALVDLIHASLPSAVPVQAWEVGQFWPNAPSDEHVHADELARAVNGLLDGGVQRVIWLPLAYNPAGRNPAELRFGLVDPDGRIRESGRVFAEIAAAHARA
ncbi:MAG: hypothetical protein JO265_03685 [Acidimicrobiia bacterium]|nr:hypothetical protein [Acidimicrobiia bacterium]